MIAHEPRDEPRLVAPEALLQAEGLGVDRAELGVIPAPALRDVVEQRGEIGELLARQGLHDLAQHRKFVVVLRHGQPPQVAHHEEGMSVHGVGVEQVVLHAPDHAPERRNVAAENAVQVHAPQLVRDSDRGAENLHEQPVMARILAEFLVDQGNVRADQTDGLGTHAAQLRVLLQKHEQLQQRGRIAGEHLGMGDLEIVVTDLEARVDGDRRPALGQNRLAKQLQQHFVEQAHVHHGAVVLLHELLDREREARILVAEELGELDLVVEQQAVLAAAGEHVQPEPYLPEERLARLELAQLLARQKAVSDQLIERVGAEVALGDPADGLDVAQAPRARFDVGLEVVSGIEIAVSGALPVP